MKALLALLLMASPLFAQTKLSLEQRVTPKPNGVTGAIPFVSSTTLFAYTGAGANGKVLGFASGVPTWINPVPASGPAGCLVYSTSTTALGCLTLGTEGYPLVAGASAPAWNNIIGKVPAGWLTAADSQQFVVRGRLLVGATDAVLTSDSRVLGVYGSNGTGVSVELATFLAPSLNTSSKAFIYFGQSIAAYGGWIFAYRHGYHASGEPHHLSIYSTEATNGRAQDFVAKDSSGDSNTPDSINFGLNGADVSNTACTAGINENTWGCQKFTLDLASGNIKKIRNLAYSWPTVHAVGFLKDDGTGALTWTAGTSGTVTSLSFGTLGALFTGSISNPTTTAAINLDFATCAANRVIASGTSGGSAVPTCRALVVADVPTLNQDTTGKSAKTDALNSATTIVNVAAATAPSVGQVLTATSSTAATWQTPTSNPVTTKGDLATFSTVADRLPVGSNGQVLVADSTQTTGIKWAASGTVVGATGTQWLRADPNFSVGTSFERISKGRTNGVDSAGLVQLKPNTTWVETIADCKANVPAGWTLLNPTKWASCNANTTTANALRIVADNTTTYDITTSVTTGPFLYRTYAQTSGFFQTWVSRIALQNASGAETAVEMCLMDSAAVTKIARIGVYNVSTASTYRIYADDVVGSTNPVTTLTLAQIQAGVWFMMSRALNGFACSYYNTANQATPPSTWTLGRCNQQTYADNGSPTRVGWVMYRGNNAATADILYFDDFAAEETRFPRDTVAALNGWTGTGLDNTSPVLTLIAGFNLGSSTASVANADLQAAAAEVTNVRSTDTATITWSFSRGSSPPVACGGGTYASAATATVGGTGQYISVCAKALSTGRVLPGSINADAFRAPYTP